MLYYIEFGAIITLITIVYILLVRRRKEEENIIEYIWKLNVSEEALERHAEEITKISINSDGRILRKKIMRGFKKSYISIVKGYEFIDREMKERNEVPLAAEWLLDNFYLIDKEYKDIKLNLPEPYYNDLPVIAEGPMKGYPRAYYIALQLVSHTDGKVTWKNIEKFINTYQNKKIFTMGELWAIPTMIRIALMQNIAKIVEKIVVSQKEQKKGEELAEKILNINSENIEALVKELKEKDIYFSTAFTERLIKVLRNSGFQDPLVFEWIDESLSKNDTDLEKLISLEHQMQSKYQILIGNCITGIREVNSLCWKESFEKLSLVERLLVEDPIKIYDEMDFSSKDFYRHKIEKIAKKTKLAESFIAKKAIECSREADKEELEEYKKHVGYYLIDEGFETLKKKIKYKENCWDKIKNTITRNILGFYIGTIALLTLTLIFFVFKTAFQYENSFKFWEYVCAFFVILIPCSEIIISSLNWSISQLLEPRHIPKLHLKDGISDENKTIVVIPTLIDNPDRVKSLVNNMEVYYLANREKNLYFAILGDFKDSNREKEEKDEKIIKTALEEVAFLNKKYSVDGKDIFFFFNRFRQFNEKEGKWLGWERKRGKLVEFNKLLRGEKTTSYNTISGDIREISEVKYVITLDGDTQLPRDTAKKLIGAMAHVLNKPHVDLKNKKIKRGHGLMQPRISVSTISANKTLFSKIFSGETGIDLYTTAVSDIYEDLFDEGIFTGKGIYDLDVFSKILEGEIPENLVLSHDLLEGSYVRAALVTDIELIDGYPAFYNANSKRLHRWIRGDWQIIGWLTKKSPLNTLSRWKIFDNLRRSLLAPSIILLLIFAFSFLSGNDEWLIVAFVSILCPIFFHVSETVVLPVKGISLSGRVNNVKLLIEQVFLIFCFLPYQAYLMTDAIIRTLYRLFISKKNLLEWQTAADAEASAGRELRDFTKQMWVGSFISIIIAALAFKESIKVGVIIAPSCIVWFFSPYIAYYISTNKKSNIHQLNITEINMLRKLSRRTWAYFEDFVVDSENWLAPDNYQENPNNGVAHRTSPTNMAMGLTSNLVAYNMGYIEISKLVERLENTIESMEGLERYKGHFYNWYNTKTKEPLNPKYISTVDSGNLVGYLWLINSSLNQYIENPLLREENYKGLKDILLILEEEHIEDEDLREFNIALIKKVNELPLDIFSWRKFLVGLLGEINRIKDNYWVHKLKENALSFFLQTERFCSWIELLGESSEEIYLKKELSEAIYNTAFVDLKLKLSEIKDKISDSEIQNKEKLNTELEKSIRELNNISEKIKGLKNKIKDMAYKTDFTMLYNKKKELFSIGYEVEKENIQNCYYDLLASEARQASFVAIAKGDVASSHWFKLGRSVVSSNGNKAVVSWSGTMFEYLMPLLVMKSYENTLLHETYKGVVEAQQRYCKDKKIPWGISESAFYNFDINLNYQYKAFGIPRIGLKRGLSKDLVIAPYASVMALQVDLKAAADNITRLIKEGTLGKYGLYEAVDYTKERLPKGKNKEIIKCFMVHHQGMSLMALDNVLNDNILQELFHRLPRVKATELLLQEKTPKNIIYDREYKHEDSEMPIIKPNIVVRRYNTYKTEIPEAQLLSSGEYSLMITNSGSGYSRKGDMTVYRWKEDVTTEDSGMFIYIKNLNSNEYWSSAYEPCKWEGEEYEVVFSLDKAGFKRKDGNLTTSTEITVSGEDNVEVRKITIANNSDHERVVELTSYCEVTLAPYLADLVHPAFSNLFIKTEYIDNPSCIIGSRKPRSKDGNRPWIFETLAIEGEQVGSIEYETSRANFIGRCRDLKNPQALDSEATLTRTVGAVLDPIISMRVRMKIPKGESIKVAFALGVTKEREEAIELARKYRDMQNVARIFDLALTQSTVEIKYLGIKYSQANLYQLMASKILFLNNSFNGRENYIKNIKKGQSALWAYGISGDIPIVLVLIKSEGDKDIVRQMLSAHEYWSLKGLKVDLVLINVQNSSYIQELQDSIRDLISGSYARDKQNISGGVYLYSNATMSKEDIVLLMAISRIVIDSSKGSLITQIKNSLKVTTKEEDKLQVEKISYKTNEFKFDIPKLLYFNEFGGFSREGDEYIIHLKDKQNTPAPWINVISNGNFGFHISENGVAYSWNKNSRENKITAWSNDAVVDGEAEAHFIRDEKTGEYWSISPKPVRDNGEYIIQHGFGYSTYKHFASGIIGEMTVFVDMDAPVKLCKFKLKNNSNEKRRLSLTYYGKLVHGVTHEQTAQYIVTGLNKERNYIFSYNPYSEHFKGMYSFLKIIGGNEESFTGNRKEFLGRGGNIADPQMIYSERLSDTVGGGFDPCISSNSKFELGVGEEKEVYVVLGQCEGEEEVNRIIDKFNNIGEVNLSLERAKNYWNKILGTIQVKTPDKAMDIMVNGWLMYQVISCRFWARTAFYQSGGAFGFRDQLQDVMSVAYLEPKLTRNHIIYSASRQYLEGDVQHWWHPVVESGIRTRFSDDLLWLPYVTIDYIKNTGDYSILEEKSKYLEDEPLKENEDERYNISRVSKEEASIYEHCIKTIERSLKFGEHNIPLMGCGDWNDGMSTVGNQGKGESVWVGWFLYTILNGFKDICVYKKDLERAEKYKNAMEFIKENLEENAWDGGWYRRAYFDDGTPLGSIENDECQIDSLSQSWAVISGAAKMSRIKESMKALEKNLIKEDKGIVLLFTPAFEKSRLEPGYIKGYVPGVRENGGQYTHAAIWVIIAYAKIGEGDKAWKVFNMLNPINHGKSYLDCQTYKTEPYVIAADIYAVEPHVGRGGWSWYTGAAGWMYRAAVENILGLKFIEGKGFKIEPCIPKEWNKYEINYKKDSSVYNITVERSSEKEKATFVNGEKVLDGIVPFYAEGEFQVKIII